MAGFSQKIFVACDNEVLTKQQICEAALASKLFPDATMPQVTVIVEYVQFVYTAHSTV